MTAPSYSRRPATGGMTTVSSASAPACSAVSCGSPVARSPLVLYQVYILTSLLTPFDPTLYPGDGYANSVSVWSPALKPRNLLCVASYFCPPHFSCIQSNTGLSPGAGAEGRCIVLYSVYAVYCIARLYTLVLYNDKSVVQRTIAVYGRYALFLLYKLYTGLYRAQALNHQQRFESSLTYHL